MSDETSWQDYAFLFDMDGVLISLKARWINPLEEIFSKIKPDFNREAISKQSSSLLLVHGGRTNVLMIQGILEVCNVGGLNFIQKIRVLVRLSFVLMRRKKFPIIPLNGSIDTLKELKEMGFKLALVTSASRFTARRLKRYHPELHNKFQCIVTRGDVRFTKPYPDQLLIALEKLEVEKSKAAMVGDFTSDVYAGKNAGIKTIGVLGEFPEMNRVLLESSNPDIILKDITEIPQIISQFFKA